MKKLLTLTLIILTLGLIPIIFNVSYISGSDFINQQLPFILETKRVLSSGTPFWSWNTFSGGNFISQYSFYTLTSPFVWIILLFPYKYVLTGILLATYLKFFVCSIVTYYLLKRIGFDENLSVIGALLYTFSNFFISNLYYFHFAEPIIMFPVLLLSIENVLKQGKYSYQLLSITVFGVVFINYYFAFGSLILGFLYLIFRSYGLGKLKFSLIFKSLIFAVVGVLLASFILIPIVSDVFMSARGIPGRGFDVIETGSSSNMIRYIGRFLTRILSLFYPTVYESTPQDDLISNSNWTSTEAYLMIFGLLTSLAHFIKVRNYLSVLIIILTIVYLFPPLNGIFSLYTSITYGRWLYGLLLFMIMATLDLFKRRISIPKRLFWGYITFCIIGIGVVFLYSWETKIGDSFTLSPTRWVELAVCLLNFGCLLLWQFMKRNKIKCLTWMTSICGLANLWAFAYFLIPLYEDLSHKTAALSVKPELFVEGNSEVSYRFDDITTFKNYSMLTNRPGIYSFHSVYPKSLIPFRSAIDGDVSDPNFSNSYHNQQSVGTLLSVRDIRVYNEFRDSIPYDFKDLSLTEVTETYSEYSFKQYIPFGFAYDHYIVDDEIINLIPQSDSIDVPSLLLDNLAITKADEPVFSKILKKGVINYNADTDSLVRERRKYTVHDFKGTNKGYSFKTDFQTPKVLFISVPYDKGFQAKLDSEPIKLYTSQLGMTAIIVPEGIHEVSVVFIPEGLRLGLIISVISFLILLFSFHSRKSKVLTQ